MTADPALERLPAEILDPYDGFAARLREVPYSWEAEGLSVSGNFYYLPFGGDGNVTVADFVTFIYHKIIYFCVPRSECVAALDLSFKKKDMRYVMDLHDKAKALFVRAKNSRKTSGEPGELVLFTLNERVLSAPQIACKMSLKTSTKMHVHGSDSIHATVSKSGDGIVIIWGESKLHKDLSSALDDICESLGNFIKIENGENQRQRDIEIIKQFPNVLDEKLKELIIDSMDPYSDASNKRQEVYSCLVAYSEPRLPALAKDAKIDREQAFQEFYTKRIETACALFANKIKAGGLSSLVIHFFLIPFPDVMDFRKDFFTKLGVNIDDFDTNAASKVNVSPNGSASS